MFLTGSLLVLTMVPTPVAPVLCYDEAHRNAHGSETGYAAFVELARGAGFEVVPMTESWATGALARCALLAVVSPRGAGREASLQERGQPAFAATEVAALAEWLAAGRGLLLVTDHPPIGSAAAPLAHRLGVDMSNAFTEDAEHTAPEGYLVFSRANGLLASHPITEGLEKSHAVVAVAGFLGQSLEGPPGAQSLLTFGSGAVDRVRASTDRLWLDPSPHDVLSAAAGRSQAVAFAFAAGRVVVFGDAAMLTSLGSNSGFDLPGFDNRQLAVNVLKWLAGEID